MCVCVCVCLSLLFDDCVCVYVYDDEDDDDDDSGARSCKKDSCCRGGIVNIFIRVNSLENHTAIRHIYHTYAQQDIRVCGDDHFQPPIRQ